VRYEGFVVPPAGVDDTQEALFEVAPPPAPPKPRNSLLYVVTALAVLFGLATAIVVPAYIRLRNDHSGNDADRTEATTVAAQVAEAITSLDAQGANQAQADRIRALGTGPLIEQYTDAIAAIQKTFAPLKVQSIRGQVSKVYVGDIAGDQGEALVVVDLVIVGDSPRVVPDQYLRVHLAKIDGAWKVDNVENINVALAAQSSTSSTAPPATSSDVPPSTESSSG
jgi:hypothetical protein